MNSRFIFSALAILAIWGLFSCSSYREAYVTHTGEDGKILMEDAGGSTTPERHLNIRVQQEETNTLEEMEQQQRSALKRKDMMMVDSLQDLIDRKKFPQRYGAFNGASGYGGYNRQVAASNGRPVKLAMINNSKDDVRILNGPFAGMTLNAGKKTAKALSWPSGSFRLEYEVIPIGGSWTFIKKVNVSIPEDRTEPISFY